MEMPTSRPASSHAGRWREMRRANSRMPGLFRPMAFWMAENSSTVRTLGWSGLPARGRRVPVPTVTAPKPSEEKAGRNHAFLDAPAARTNGLRSESGVDPSAKEREQAAEGGGVQSETKWNSWPRMARDSWRSSADGMVSRSAARKRSEQVLG